MTFPRSSGVLLHPTCLPGPFGIGDLGEQSYDFVDFLVSCGQSLWQVLPLGPTGYGNSPYACYSAFAGNTLLISPASLVANGLLLPAELEDLPEFSADSVDFESVRRFKTSLLKQAFVRFSQLRPQEIRADFEQFCVAQAEWLDDYALFSALKDAHDGRIWNDWNPSYVARVPADLDRVRNGLRPQIESHKFSQFLFFSQWSKLRSYCHKNGVKLIGDIPIFIAEDSADVWTNPSQFKLDNNGKPTVVAGVPPDYFSKTGQLWGNPIYNWDRMRADGFKWWIKRIRATLQMVDIVRVDHFRGFVASWEIPAGDKTAERGRWVEAPGRALFTAVNEVLGEVPIIAEDLGVITPEVEQLRDDFDFPGMRVLQFAFGGDPKNSDLPHNYRRNTVVYTGTHDNDTTVGWFSETTGVTSTREVEEIRREREFCLKYLKSNGSEIHWDFIRAALGSVANTAIIPVQDLLGLGSDARMNLPNSVSGNWTWRLHEGSLTSGISDRLRELTAIFGRLLSHD